MQLLCRHAFADLDRWRAVFADEGPAQAARRTAGLALRQVWRDGERAGEAWLLYEVSDRALAEDFMAGETAREDARRAGVREADCIFVERAP